jgi:hypothetical protein
MEVGWDEREASANVGQLGSWEWSEWGHSLGHGFLIRRIWQRLGLLTLGIGGGRERETASFSLMRLRPTISWSLSPLCFLCHGVD